MKLVPCLLSLISVVAASGLDQSHRSSQLADDRAVLHGQYLVKQVAMCGQCHTPRDRQGYLLKSEWLQGAPVLVSSPFPNQIWANTVPAIAGLQAYTDEQGVRLFTTGIARTGRPLQPPMPQFRFTEQDARAVVAYLRSLH